MVRDLLRGFAARGWSTELDLDSLTPLPASYVSHDLRQRHGDLVWRVRFKDDRWLYVVLLLESHSAVDRSMAVRMLTYTALLYQRLIAEGVLRECSGLPPVLPVVIYNGRRPWKAPVDVAELIASGRGAALARYQPSQRFFLVDEARVGGRDLPSGNLVSALIALETNRDRVRAPALLGALIDLLRKQDDEELTAAFGEWAAQVLLPRRFRGSVTGPLPRLESGSNRAESRASGNCCAVRRRGSSMQPRRSGWPRSSRASRMRIAWRKWVTGSSSARRQTICSLGSRIGRSREWMKRRGAFSP